MTYGVDQCRRCGKALKITSPDAGRRYEESLRKPPIWPEKKWRAQGWKSCPNSYQAQHPLDGVCRDCKPIVVRERRTPLTFYVRLLACVAAFFVVVLGVLSVTY